MGQETAEVAQFLRSHAALTLFVCIAVGYLLGRIPLGGVRIGGICGTVIAALIVGQAGVQVAPGAAGLSFSLFIYSLGYLGGPAFLSGLSRRSIALMIFPALQLGVTLTVTLIATRVLRLSTSTALGLLTGASSQSAALGTAVGLVPASDVPGLTTSFAVSYLVSILVTVVFVSQIIPRFLPATGAGDPVGDPIAPPDVVGRAFRVISTTPVDLTILRARLGHRVVIAEVVRGATPRRRPGQEFTPDSHLVSSGDILRLIGSRDVLATASTHIGPEVPLPEASCTAVAVINVVVSRSGSRNITLRSLRESSVVVVAGRRLNQTFDTSDDGKLQAGDVLSIAGEHHHLTRQTVLLGTRLDATSTTDFAFLGAGLAIGIGIGLASLRVGSVALSLGGSAAVLLTGLFIGWLNSRRHTLGPYNPAAAEVVKDLGLAIFIACTALTAAPGAWQFLRQYGLVVPAITAFIVIATALTSLFICARLLRLSPLRTLGVLAGQQSSSPTMSALQAQFNSSEPLLSYVPIYAAATILGPVLMPLIVPLISAVTR